MRMLCGFVAVAAILTGIYNVGAGAVSGCVACGRVGCGAVM